MRYSSHFSQVERIILTSGIYQSDMERDVAYSESVVRMLIDKIGLTPN